MKLPIKSFKIMNIVDFKEDAIEVGSRASGPITKYGLHILDTSTTVTIPSQPGRI